MYKNYMRRALRAVAAVAVTCMMWACGDSEKAKLEKLDEAAAEINTLTSGVVAPLSNGKAVVSDHDIVVSMELNDSMIDPARLTDVIMDYYVAQQIKTLPKDMVNATVKALEATEGSLILNLTSASGSAGRFSFAPATLRELYKAKGSQLNAPRVKEQLCTLLTGTLPSTFAWADADHVEINIEKSFLTYHVVFTTDRTYSSSGQGLLTRLYFEPFKARMAALGSLEAPVLTMLKSLGIDGFCVSYEALNGDKVIRQAFPWRVLDE